MGVIAGFGLLAIGSLISSSSTAAGAEAAGSLAGTVRVANGVESGVIEGRYVCALERAQMLVVSCTETNSSGGYTISGLPKGEYEIDFTALPCALQPCESPYLPQYYDDEPTLASATPVLVNAPASVGGIDATLEMVMSPGVESDPVNEYLKHEGLEEPTESFTFAGPGAIQPAPVNPQIEKEFYEHPPWERSAPLTPAALLSAGVASVARGDVAVRRGGALVHLHCSAAGACAGSVALLARVDETHLIRRDGKRVRVRRMRRLRIGAASFSLPSGSSETVRVPLTITGRNLFRKSGRRGLNVTLKIGSLLTGATLTGA